MGTSGQSEAIECGYCSRENLKSDGTNERTERRLGETQHGVCGRNKLGGIKDHEGRERTNSLEDARGSGDDQTEWDVEESVEHLQPDGAVAVDDILVPK